MNPIQIQILNGPGAGRRVSFTSTPITFGRDPDSTLVVADSIASRKHGEIRQEGEGWVLVNLSPNGTRVNRRKVTSEPQPLRDGDTIYVEKQALFSIGIEAAEDKDKKPAAPKKLKAPVNKRARLWLWLTGYAAAMLLLLVFFSTLGTGGHTDPRATVPVLLSDDIAREISRPAKVPGLDPDKAKRCLEQAQKDYSSIRSPTDFYPAYHNFQEALAYSGRDSFDSPDDWNHYRDVKERLIAEVKRQYTIACNKRTNSKEAIAAFNQVLNLYPDMDSTIHKNASRQIEEASNQIR
jgi:pSer/pThr/pTyr-binding forkhead associated (FHA) protein